MSKPSGLWGIPVKVAAGYVALLAVAALAVALVYSYTRSAVELSDVARCTGERREAMNSLTVGMFRLDNAERAIFMGHTDREEAYCRAADSVLAHADSLAVLLTDSGQRARVDTLRALLMRKRENTLLLLAAMDGGGRASLYERKAERLRSGRDSVMVHKSVPRASGEKRVTYVVNKTRRTFFGRLADAFRRQRNDTTATTVDSVAAAADSVRQAIDVAAPVADVLDDIGRAEESMRLSRRGRIRREGEALLAAGIQLADRTGRLMDDIGRAETQWLRKAAVRDAANRRSAATRVWLLAALAVLVASVSLVFVWRDNRRADRYRRSLEQARARAERLLAQRERLLLTITHDIKSPVAAISGFVELLRAHVSAPRPVAYIDNIRSSATHLLALVGSLLDYHQLEKGQISIRRSSFSPARLTADCVGSFRPRAVAAGLSLTLRYTTDAGALSRGDAFRIRQVMENLIGNAVKYTSEGGVTVTAGVAGGMFTFSVADTGRGMTAEESSRIFDAFVRLPGAQGVDGVGLGLSITHELVSLLGGTISVESRPGSGSVFTVAVPVEEAAGIAAETVPPAAGDGEIDALRVLVIDDDTVMLDLIGSMLSRLSSGRCHVVACTQVEEFFVRLDAEPFDIIFTDIEMPGMSGFNIVRRIAGRGIPVVAMTAHDSLGDAVFTDAGFAARLSKPFSVGQLAEVVSAVCRPAESAGGREGGAEEAGDASEDSAALHLDALTEFAGGDAAAARGIIDSFRESTLRDIAAMREALAAGDVAAAGELAHRLIPVFTMIGSPIAPVLRMLSDERQAGGVPAGWHGRCSEVIAGLEQAAAAAGHPERFI